MFNIFFKLFFKIVHFENYLNSSLLPCTCYFITWFCLLDVILSHSGLASFCCLDEFLKCWLNGLSASFTWVIIFRETVKFFRYSHCAPCMVIDCFQKRFVIYMQLRQCFSRAKPFRLQQSQKNLILSVFLLFSKKAKGVQKRQNFNIWFQKSQIGNLGPK